MNLGGHWFLETKNIKRNPLFSEPNEATEANLNEVNFYKSFSNQTFEYPTRFLLLRTTRMIAKIKIAVAIDPITIPAICPPVRPDVGLTAVKVKMHLDGLQGDTSNVELELDTSDA